MNLDRFKGAEQRRAKQRECMAMLRSSRNPRTKARQEAEAKREAYWQYAYEADIQRGARFAAANHCRVSCEENDR